MATWKCPLDVLKLQRISHWGNANERIRKFTGADRMELLNLVS